MECTRDSDAGRRVTDLKRAVVLQLFTKFGPFHAAVQQVRVRWNITAPAKLPPVLSDGIYLPPGLPATCDGSWGIEARKARLQAFHSWTADILELVDNFVPVEFRYDDWRLGPLVHIQAEGRFWQANSWQRFISACVCFDPPETELLPFADQIEIKPHPQWPQMVAPPVKYLCDTNTVFQNETWWWSSILQSLLDRLRLLGVDGEALLTEVLSDATELRQEYFERINENYPRPYIAIGPDTTREDVVRAFQSIAAKQPARPPAKRPNRDPLTAVQCAVWRDEYRWSHRRIAEHFGWAVSEDEYGTPRRSETARAHIQLGRQLLRQKKPGT